MLQEDIDEIYTNHMVATQKRLKINRASRTCVCGEQDCKKFEWISHMKNIDEVFHKKTVESLVTEIKKKNFK